MKIHINYSQQKQKVLLQREVGHNRNLLTTLRKPPKSKHPLKPTLLTINPYTPKP